MNKKIRDLYDLAEQLKKFKDKIIVHCHGVFDLLHIGHIRHFERAKEHGDILVVTISPDKYVDKGPTRPAFSQELRAEALASLACVDFVAVNQWPTAEETLRLIRPHVYAKGSEFKEADPDAVGKIGPEIDAVKEIGAKIVFTEDVIFSSSNLINRHLSGLSPEMDEYMKLFRKRHTLSELRETLAGMKNLKVLIVGEAIIDEYVYGEAIGKSSKDPVLALLQGDVEVFAGGVLAVANHVAQFADSINLLTVLGRQNSWEDMIRSKLAPNVSPTFVFQENAPTIVKRRFIDTGSLNKLLEVYLMERNGLKIHEDKMLRDQLTECILDYDLVLVTDYGHGTISQETANFIADNAPFLAVNTQANAGNRGLHTISRYRRADFVALAEHEVRLEVRSMTRPNRGQLRGVADQLSTKDFIMTCGHEGCIILSREGDYIRIPTLVSKAVDRVGAGDALFSVAALASCVGADSEIVGLLGNIAGTLAVNTVGNEKPVQAKEIDRCITALMK